MNHHAYSDSLPLKRVILRYSMPFGLTLVEWIPGHKPRYAGRLDPREVLACGHEMRCHLPPAKRRRCWMCGPKAVKP